MCPQTTNQRTSGTAYPRYGANNSSPPTRSGPRQNPSPTPSATNQRQRSATKPRPQTGGVTKTNAYMTPRRESDIPVAEIIVMGATGSGKSTFINLVSGSSLGVGKGLGSCTNTVQMAEPFNLDGHRVVLIDTPGFGDTTQSDTDILRTIAAFLEASYERGNILAGVLYFHRISDTRMSGALTKNFRVIQSICGDRAMKNVVIVTNMWGGVEPEVGNAREAELMTDDIFFKPALDKGTRMARNDNTVPSAEAVIRLLVNSRPLPLQIQTELVTEHKDITDTSAGQEVNRELSGQIRKNREDIRDLTKEMELAAKDKDEETRRELEGEARRMQNEIEKFENEAKRLKSEYRREKSEFQARLADIEGGRMGEYRGAEDWQQRFSRGGDTAFSSPYRSSPTSTPTTRGRFTTDPKPPSRSLWSRFVG